MACSALARPVSRRHEEPRSAQEQVARFRLARGRALSQPSGLEHHLIGAPTYVTAATSPQSCRTRRSRYLFLALEVQHDRSRASTLVVDLPRTNDRVSGLQPIQLPASWWDRGIDDFTYKLTESGNASQERSERK